MNNDEYKDFKNYKINLNNLDWLDEKTFGMLIDSLVDYYVNKFGLDMSSMSLNEPEKPQYDAENLNVAKDYLKKFRING